MTNQEKFERLLLNYVQLQQKWDEAIGRVCVKDCWKIAQEQDELYFKMQKLIKD